MRAALALFVVLAACNPDDGKPTQPIKYLTPDASEGGASSTPTDEPLGAPCSDNTQCDSGVCQVGGSQTWCTVKCTSNDDCPAGLAHQCNPKGVCSHL